MEHREGTNGQLSSQPRRKLGVARETLRALGGAALRQAAGGTAYGYSQTDCTNCCSATNECTLCCTRTDDSTCCDGQHTPTYEATGCMSTCVEDTCWCTEPHCA